MAIIEIQYVPANTQPWVNARAANQYHWLVKIRSFWCHFACFREQMQQICPNFALMLGFYHNLSITSPKKISCKLFTMLSKIYRALCSFALLKKDERYIYFQRMELMPIRQNKLWIFYANFSMKASFPLGYGPTKPRPNPVGFFPEGHLKNKIFATPPATIEELKWLINMKIQNITQKTLRKVSRIWCTALLHIKISMECIFSICYSL